MKLSVSQLSDFIKTCQRCFARKKIKLIETYRKYSKQKKTVEIQVFFKTPVDLMILIILPVTSQKSSQMMLKVH
nr:hypothetical protein BgiMline_019444 [Biomphalaria glabrata]